MLDHGRIVGVLSARDALFVETLRDVDPSQVTVEEAMSTEVYAVAPQTHLALVAREMAEQNYGCVVVIESGRVEGVFTSVDAMRVLQTFLEPPGDGRSATSIEQA